MNWAIWKKAVSDAWRQFLASSIILVLFSWIFVWLMAQIETRQWGILLQILPRRLMEPLLGFPIDALFTHVGQLSILFVHVITLLVCVGWALGRGSDPISGEISRGTMDLLVTLPVRRATVMIVPSIIAAVGAAGLCGSVWLGIAAGVRSFGLADQVELGRFLPGAVNLFAMIFCFLGITTFVSSWNADRWRTMAIAGGFFIISLVVEIVAKMWEAGAWLGYLTFLNAFQPQRLILMADTVGNMALRYDLTLVGIGTLCFVAAGLVFWRRDIPSSR